MTHAVIKTGGKQYLVTEGDVLDVELLAGKKAGDKVSFEVLTTDNGSAISVGTPTVAGAKVDASVVEVGRDKKIIVIHYLQKSRYFKKNGHRQPFTKVKIDKITA
jgi:large subunit ribosomal protein L21